MCMHILNRNVIVAQRTVTKKRFLRYNRCIELGKRDVALHKSARVKQLTPEFDSRLSQYVKDKP